MLRPLLIGLVAVQLTVAGFGPLALNRLALDAPVQQARSESSAQASPVQSPQQTPVPAESPSALPGTTDHPLPPATTGAPSVPALLPANARSGIQGAWLRPDRRPATEVLAPLEKAGYTDIFVESFYHGMTIYPSKVAPQRPEFRGADKLNEYREAAAALGLRLHAWIEVLYWAPPVRYRSDTGLLALHPEWETRDISGADSTWGKLGMGFVDPSIYGVRQTVYALSRELARNYSQLGLHLDYLRYPAGGEYGYHPEAARAFSQLTGRLPSRLDPRWYAYRQDLLTQVANGMSKAYREAGGQGLVTAAVNPNYPFYKVETLQIWPRWTGVDVFIPMAYSQSTTYLQFLSRYVRARSPRPVWMGLLVGEGYPSLETQVATLKREGYSNFVVFGLR